MDTVLSGIRSTGNLHLGNYLGAVRNFVRMQEGNNCYFFIADYHAFNYFETFYSVNENLNPPLDWRSIPISADKIVINHYYTKSHEEFLAKFNRGRSDVLIGYSSVSFNNYNRNEVFDDGILKYRAARAENFSLASDEQRIQRTEKVLIATLTQQSPFDTPSEFFTGKLETFLTCRKLAEVFGTRINSKSAEEFALTWIYQTLNTDGVLTYADLQLLMRELPEILSRPFPVAKKVARLFSEKMLPSMVDVVKSAKISDTWQELWREVDNLNYIRRFLNSILR